MRPTLHLALLVLLASASSFAQTASPPPATPTKPALPRDSHDGVTISADPYVDAARGKDKFGKANPFEAGILALEVFLRNDRPHALRINLETIQLEIHFHESGRQDIDWLTPIEVADLIAHPRGVPNAQTRRLPGGIPLPNRDKKTGKIAEMLRPFALDADILPPLSTIHGFLFFNLAHRMSLENGATLYVPDIVDIGKNQPLIFFEVALGSSDPP